jgi:hypothetical protein
MLFKRYLQQYLADVPAWQIGLATVLMGAGASIFVAQSLVGSRSPAPERSLAQLVVVARSAPNSEIQPPQARTAVAVTASPRGTDVTGAGMSISQALHKSLRRAECYDGPLDGAWTRRSKDAMARFLAATNSTLPVERPDQVLLALIQTNPTARCSSGTSAKDPASAPRVVASLEPAAQQIAVNFSPPVPLRTDPSQPIPKAVVSIAPKPSPTPAPTPAAVAVAVTAPAQSQPDPASLAAAALAAPVVALASPPRRAARSLRTGRPVRVARPAFRRHIHRRNANPSVAAISRTLSRNVRSLQRALTSGF